MSFKMMDFLMEGGRKYEYGCAMLYFDFPQMFKIQDAIDPDNVYEDPDDDSFGFETEPHITLLFGLHKEVTDEQVKDIVTKFVYGPITISKLSTFDNLDYDVLKFDIPNTSSGAGFLYKANKDLAKLPHTTDFPNYHPHMTVVYLKKGTGKKWIKKLKSQEYTLTPKYAKFSKPNKEEKKIEIRVSK